MPASSPVVLGANFEVWSNAPTLNGLVGGDSLEKFPKRISLLQPHSAEAGVSCDYAHSAPSAGAVDLICMRVIYRVEGGGPRKHTGGAPGAGRTWNLALAICGLHHRHYVHLHIY